MSFLAPLFLLGLAAAAVPVVIHLIGRQRAPRRKFAALDFVLASNRKVARRLRLRQLLLLALRALLVAAVAVMLAKPFAELESDLPAVSEGQKSVVFIIDDTLSMRRQVKGETLFARAGAKARQLTTMLSQADVAVISVTAPDGPLPSLTRDVRKVRAAIAGLQATYRHATAAAALEQAARVLADSVLPERHVFFISDGAAHGWSPEMGELMQGARLHLINVAEELLPENVAVTELAAAPSSAPGLRSTALRARVCNYSGQQATRTVSLSIDGKLTLKSQLSLKPWACDEKVFQHSFSRGGVHQALVELEADALPADDRRYLLLELESPLRVLFVNGDPSPVRYRDELFYLGAALAPAGVGGQPIDVKEVLSSELEQLLFDSYDVVALVNLRDFPESRAAALREFVRKGGGLLIALGDNSEPEALNQGLGDLLPQPLRGPVAAVAPGSGEPTLQVGRVDSAHPILSSIWTDQQRGGLRAARFQKVYRLSPVPEGARRVVLWYDDGTPLLVEAARGKGRTLLYTSTLDRDWNDLPIRPGYLPLVQQMVRYLGGAGAPSMRRSAEVGEVVAVTLDKGSERMQLLDPSGAERLWTKLELGDRQAVEVFAASPGFYQLQAAGSDGVLRELKREGFAANVSPRESDLRPAMAAAVGSPAVGTARAKRRLELWHGLGVALLLLLLGESFLIRRG